MKYLSVKNFTKHQHYKNRRPPWIKLHTDVLTHYEFSCLQDASKAHLMLLWVLASRTDNKIPNDPEWIARQLQSTSPIDLQELVAYGFLEEHEDASKPLAPRKQSATPEVERETEADKRKKSPRKDAATWITPFSDAWRARFGGELHIGKSARPLAGLRAADPDARPEVLRRWGIYLEATSSGQYASAAKFAETYGEWEHPPPIRMNGNGSRPGIANRVFAKGMDALRDE